MYMSCIMSGVDPTGDGVMENTFIDLYKHIVCDLQVPVIFLSKWVTKYVSR